MQIRANTAYAVFTGLPVDAKRFARVRPLPRHLQGSMSRVYSAFDRVTQREVVLKRALPERPDEPSPKRMLATEGDILADVTRRRIPGVVRLLDRVHIHGKEYLVLERVAGQTLWQARQADATCYGSEGDARAVMRQLLTTLARLHDVGVSWGDAKLGNTFIARRADASVQVTLIDFGAGTRERMTDEMRGSTRHIAPEQLRESYDPRRSDIFAVGVMLYILTQGAAPFRGIVGPTNAAAYTARRGSPELRDLLGNMLHPDPRQRIDAADALRAPWLSAGPRSML